MEILDRIAADPTIGKWLDRRLSPPKPYRGSGPIRVIILGQDPTVQDPDRREDIDTVLLLNRKGPLLVHVARICRDLGLTVKENVYATNYVKCFLTAPPTSLPHEVLGQFGQYWAETLKAELEEFPEALVISLGEPVLASLVGRDDTHVRDFWGYQPNWQQRGFKEFKPLRPQDNALGRLVFPHIHVKGNRRKGRDGRNFYDVRWRDYGAFIRSYLPAG